MPCCGHRLTDPPRDVTDFPVVTSVPSLGEEVSFCTLGENKEFRVRLDLEGYELPGDIHLPNFTWCWAGQRKSRPVSGAQRDPMASYALMKRCRNMVILAKSSSNLLFLLLLVSCGSYPDKSLSAVLAPNPMAIDQTSSLSSIGASPAITEHLKTRTRSLFAFWLSSSYSPGFVLWTEYRNIPLIFKENGDNLCTGDRALLKISQEIKELPPKILWPQATCCLT